MMSSTNINTVDLSDDIVDYHTSSTKKIEATIQYYNQYYNQSTMAPVERRVSQKLERRRPKPLRLIPRKPVPQIDVVSLPSSPSSSMNSFLDLGYSPAIPNSTNSAAPSILEQEDLGSPSPKAHARMETVKPAIQISPSTPESILSRSNRYVDSPPSSPISSCSSPPPSPSPKILEMRSLPSLLLTKPSTQQKSSSKASEEEKKERRSSAISINPARVYLHEPSSAIRTFASASSASMSKSSLLLSPNFNSSRASLGRKQRRLSSHETLLLTPGVKVIGHGWGGGPQKSPKKHWYNPRIRSSGSLTPTAMKSKWSSSINYGNLGGISRSRSTPQLPSAVSTEPESTKPTEPRTRVAAPPALGRQNTVGRKAKSHTRKSRPVIPARMRSLGTPKRPRFTTFRSETASPHRDVFTEVPQNAAQNEEVRSPKKVNRKISFSLSQKVMSIMDEQIGGEPTSVPMAREPKRQPIFQTESEENPRPKFRLSSLNSLNTQKWKATISKAQARLSKVYTNKATQFAQTAKSATEKPVKRTTTQDNARVALQQDKDNVAPPPIAKSFYQQPSTYSKLALSLQNNASQFDLQDILDTDKRKSIISKLNLNIDLTNISSGEASGSTHNRSASDPLPTNSSSANLNLDLSSNSTPTSPNTPTLESWSHETRSHSSHTSSAETPVPETPRSSHLLPAFSVFPRSPNGPHIRQRSDPIGSSYFGEEVESLTQENWMTPTPNSLRKRVSRDSIGESVEKASFYSAEEGLDGESVDSPGSEAIEAVVVKAQPVRASIGQLYALRDIRLD